MKTIFNWEKTIYLIRGIPGSGKTTLALKLMNGNNDQVIENDHFWIDKNNKYEYNQKMTHIKTIKEYNQKLLLQVEEISIPSLEQYLYKNYSISASTSQDICEFCSRSFKSQRALSAHYRGCNKKTNDKTNSVIENIVFKK